MELSQAEKEIYHYLTDMHYNAKHISLLRRTSIRNTYKIIKNLQKKGIIKKLKYQAKKPRGTPLKKPHFPVHKIRLHGQEFNIRILGHSPRFQQAQGRVMTIDENTVKVYTRSLEIYSHKSFYGDTVEEAVSLGVAYWESFFSRLEHHLNIIIIKERYTNIKEVKTHVSECNNEVATDYNRKNIKVRWSCPQDGKLWGLIDNSYNLNEFECVHPITSPKDLERIKQAFDQYRLIDDLPLPNELFKLIIENYKMLSKLNETINPVLSLLSSPEEPRDRPDYFG